MNNNEQHDVYKYIYILYIERNLLRILKAKTKTKVSIEKYRLIFNLLIILLLILLTY